MKIPRNISLRYFALGVLIIFGLYLGKTYFFPAEEIVAATKTSTVTRETLQETIKSSGSAELVDEQKLRFNQTGKVAAVYFSSGQEVKKDQVIAELDMSDLDNEIKQAQISLSNSQISLQDLLNGSTEKEIEKTKNVVSETEQKIELSEKDLVVAQSNYKQTITDLDNELTLAKEDVTNKENDFAAAEKKYSSTSASESENLESSKVSYNASLSDALLEVKSVFLDLNDVLSNINDFMGIEGQEKDLALSYKQNISALNANYKVETETQYLSTKKVFSDVQAEYDRVQILSSLDEATIISLLQKTQSLIQTSVTLSDVYYKAVSNSVSGNNLSQSTIDSTKSSALSMTKTLKTKLDTLQSQITSIKNLEDTSIKELESDTTLTQTKNSLASAQYNLLKSQQTLQKLQSSYANSKENARLTLVKAQNDLTNLKNDLAEAQRDLADLEDGADLEDIQKARNEVTQKQLALQKTQEGKDNYQIIAPFDGVVRKIDYKKGDNIVSDDDKYVYIENPNLLEISILLDQIDIVQVEEGQKASIVFDSFPEKTFEGIISEVDQTPVTSSGVVSYTVSIALDKGENKIYSGMTATVTIITAETQNALMVPAGAVTTSNGTSVVKLKKENSFVETEVKVGMSDGKNIEILEGVVEGDVVQLNTLTVPASSSSSSSSGMGGGMGGPPM